MRNDAMKIGCCINMVAAEPEGIGIERLETLAACGYDYVEMPLAQMMALESGEFDELVSFVASVGIPCEACNNFIPASHPITGNLVDRKKLSEYIDEALDRADKLGARSIVFGSSGAKNVPEGFSMERAWEQIVETLVLVDERIGQRDIKIAIEPLCKLESNIVVNAGEGLQLAKEVNRENIRLLIDYYHLTMEHEDQAIIDRAKDYLQHMHIANPAKRVFPRVGDGVDYRQFTNNLQKAGYDARISIEAFTDDFEADAPRALRVIRDALS